MSAPAPNHGGYQDGEDAETYVQFDDGRIFQVILAYAWVDEVAHADYDYVTDRGEGADSTDDLTVIEDPPSRRADHADHDQGDAA